jgi:hypothetical protein
LQRAIGNAATTRLLDAGLIQAKLTVSHPGDASEREADRVAGEVMRMPEPQPGLNIQRFPLSVQRKCAKCEEEFKHQAVLDEEKKIVQAKPADTSAAPGMTGGLESYLNTSRGAGQPLPSSSRAYFEPRFGRDLSDVRVHTDGQASEATNSITAQAFTHGKDIVFGTGLYSPQTHQGQTLLAHELAHVVQQSGVDGIYDRQDKERRGLSSVPERPQVSQQGGIVQRAFNSDDKHNLQSDRFSGNDRLENIFDGKQEQFLRAGSNGDAVVKVQQTLIEMGFPLPKFGADGEFGNETARAVSEFKVQNGISPSDPVVGPTTIGALDTELVKLGGVKPQPIPICPDGPVNMEAEPLPPIPFPSITKMNANDLFELAKTRPGGSVLSGPPLGFTGAKFENLKPVIVKTEPVASENCFKCIADWELPQPKVEIFTATGDFSDEPKRSFPVQDQSVSGCPFESGFTTKEVIKKILPEAESIILNAELEHWSDFVLSHLLITGRYLSNVRRLTQARSHLRGNSLLECVNKVNRFLVETTTTIVPIAVPFYGILSEQAVDAVFSDSTGKRENDHSAKSVPPRGKNPIFPNIDRDINPFACNAFFRKFDKTVIRNIPGPPFSSIMEDKGKEIPPAQPWNTL